MATALLVRFYGTTFRTLWAPLGCAQRIRASADYGGVRLRPTGRGGEGPDRRWPRTDNR